MGKPIVGASAAHTHADGIAGITASVLRSRQKKIKELLDQIDAEMHDAVELDDFTRGHTQRIRGEGEKDALASVLDYADARPESFKGLADRDDGRDAAVFETALLRDRLEG